MAENPQAFPSSVKNWNDHIACDQVGMTMRDYFAAHAPDVPDWFTIEYKMEYGEMFHAPFPHGGNSHCEGSHHCAKCDEWDANQNTHAMNGKAEKLFAEMKRYFAWRSFYADAMLAERERKNV